MSAKKHNRSQGSKPAQRAGGGRSAAEVRVRKLQGEEAWELVHPRCTMDRADDMDEVRKMIEADELDIAVDEIRWLLNGCGDFIEGHKLLGEMALMAEDLPLARGHFGYAFGLGQKALKRAGVSGPLPYRVPANQSFLESGKGLAFCLKQLDKRTMAEEVIAQMLACDASDPLGVKNMLAT